ncbi:HDOD domain-containing protein [Glaciecola siphonariae]|uniref:HDOD domain-containing protein n=1 Tax=Glaciecola siphonariae TaxID=521012 RepID=A0ABV9M016_9ALTE
MKKSVSQLAGVYNSRFEQMLLSLDDAIILAGQKTEAMKMMEDSEQAESRRKLLMVEELANKQREIAATAENNFMHEIEADFHRTLVPDLEKRFNDIEDLFYNVLDFDLAIGKLLDILYTESCSISRLVSCIEQVPWLEKNLIKFVRQPKYRRVDSQGHPIILKTLHSALSFIGVESLRSLIPVLIAKNCMPIHSDFTPDLQKHLWLYTIGTGNIAKALAEKRGIRPHFGFNLGLLSTIGRSIIANVYLRSFDDKLRERIIDARKRNNPNQAKALASLKPSHKYILSLWSKHAADINAGIFNFLKCKWLLIGMGFEDYTSIQSISYKFLEEHNLHPLTKLLFNAQGYMQFKMMQTHKLMSKEASMLYLRNFGIKSDDVAVVTKINLTGIELKITESLPEES